MNENTNASQQPELPVALPRSNPSDVTIQLVRKKHGFDLSYLDIDALKVVRRLVRFGHEAYLVGGCVRDLLLDANPKDFDVVTSARPSEVKQLFRNCRLIGRRFRLAHLHFKNQKIIEVATFRREPVDGDDLTTRHAAQNLFGTAEDDAVRRDFTVNALMYDLDKGEILDWVGGLEDIRNRTICAIGEPERRLPEDPVRIIRAVKFSIKLGLHIEPRLYEEMKANAHLIVDCSKARLIEELFKILRSGYGAPCLRELHKLGALTHILPELDSAVAANSEGAFRLLECADSWVRGQKKVSDALLLAAMYYPAVEECIWEAPDVSKALSVALKPLVHPLQFTKKNLATVRHIYAAQRRMVKGPRNRRTKKIAEREYAVEALALLELTGNAEPVVLGHWHRLISNIRSHSKKPVEKQKPRRRRPPVKRTRTPKVSTD